MFRRLLLIVFMQKTLSRVIYQCEDQQAIIVNFLNEASIKMNCAPMNVCGRLSKCNYLTDKANCGGRNYYVSAVSQNDPDDSVVHTCCAYEPEMRAHVGNRCFIHALLDDNIDMTESKIRIKRSTNNSYQLQLYNLLAESNSNLYVKTIKRIESGFNVTVCAMECNIRFFTEVEVSASGESENPDLGTTTTSTPFGDPPIDVDVSTEITVDGDSSEEATTAEAQTTIDISEKSTAAKETTDTKDITTERVREETTTTAAAATTTTTTTATTLIPSKSSTASTNQAVIATTDQKAAATETVVSSEEAESSDEKSAVRDEQVAPTTQAPTTVAQKLKKPQTQQQQNIQNQQPPACFSAEMTVETVTGAKTMRELDIGDQVLVSLSDKLFAYRAVEMFYHRDESKTIEYYEIETSSGHSIQLSAFHLMPIFECGTERLDSVDDYGLMMTNSVFAYKASVEQCLIVKLRDTMLAEQITKITQINRTGVFSPITEEGTLVVNGVQVSCFSSYEHHDVQQMFYEALKDWRWLSGLFMELADRSVSRVPAVLTTFLQIADLVLSVY